MARINSEYDIGAALEAIENELIASMIRNMRRHKAEEAKEGKQWTMWQSEQLKALEKYKKANQAKYGKQFKDINVKIEELIRMANVEGQMAQETAILRAIKKGFPASKVSVGAAAEFFKLNDRKLNALVDATVSDMHKAETAILRMADDQYRKVIYNAQVYANTGAGTYEKAVDMATKDFLAAGLNCVEYKNGARHTLADYADMAIRTASKRAYLQGEGAKRQEWGIHTVIVNKRGNPCPKCLPFCGKVLIDDVWSGGSRKDGSYPLMSSAIAAGLYHPRCKDSHTTYFEGISMPSDDKYTREELDELVEKNRQEARQQYAARQEEKFSRLAEYALDSDDKIKYQEKAVEWGRIREDTSEQSDLIKTLKNKLFGNVEDQAKSFYHSLINVKDNDMYQLLRQSYKRVQIRQSAKKQSYFSRQENAIYLVKNADLSTIAHELFHEIDNTYGIIENGALGQELKRDYSYLCAISDGKSIADVLYSKYPQMFEPSYEHLTVKKEYRGVSDILNGMSVGEINLGYRHSRDYWKREKALEKETWAQYGRMYYSENGEVLGILKELFPSTTKEFERIIKEVIK